MPDRDEELERKIIRLSHDEKHSIDVRAGEPIGHTDHYPPVGDREAIKYEDLPEFIQEQIPHRPSDHHEEMTTHEKAEVKELPRLNDEEAQMPKAPSKSSQGARKEQEAEVKLPQPER